jgi:hypothetical protein
MCEIILGQIPLIALAHKLANNPTVSSPRKIDPIIASTRFLFYILVTYSSNLASKMVSQRHDLIANETVYDAAASFVRGPWWSYRLIHPLYA